MTQAGCKKKRLTVVGAGGMLGSMLAKVAVDTDLDVVPVSRQNVEFDAAKAGDAFFDAWRSCDLVVNCVAVTKPGNSPESLENLFAVNSLFPKRLADWAARNDTNVLHISTDAVYGSSESPFAESDPPEPPDAYGLSKLLGEAVTANVLNVRTSIVGPEAGQRRHIQEWLLSHADGEEVSGFTNHIWHGVTTLQLARLACRLANRDFFAAARRSTSVVHYVPNKPLSKYDLLVLLTRAYGRKIPVNPVAGPQGRKRVLHSLFNDEFEFQPSASSMSDAIQELADFDKRSK